MKKFFYMAAVALVALVACKKEETKTPDPDAVTLTSDAVVNVGAESNIVTIKFNANVSWTASTKDEFIVLNKKSGDAGDAEIKATVANLPEEELGRAGKVSITAGTASADVVLYQGKVFIVSDDVELGVAGGTAEFTVITNLEYTMKKYDGADEAFPWAPVTFDKATGKGSMAVAANAGYDARFAYVKFTVPAIQVPVYDDEGEDTGETQDAVYRFYVYQEGNSSIMWATSLTEEFNVGDGATASVALFGGKLLVSDAVKVSVVNPATGVFEGTAELGDLPVQSITSDDAGNLLVANLGPYGGLFDVYAIASSDVNSNNPNPVHLIHCVIEAWNGSTGVDKVAARGDVFKDGIVTAMYGGVPDSGGVHYGLYWTISGGKAAESSYNEWNPVVNVPTGGWFQLPLGGDNLWLSNRAAFIPAGPAASDGFFFGGYDGSYNVNYYNGTDWSVAIPEAGNWGGGPQGMGTTTWNGKKILAFIQMGYTWWSEGWGMPAYLWVADVTDPANPEILSCAEYSNPDQTISGDTENSTVDVIPTVESNDLVVYLVDTSKGIMAKVKYPKL